MKRLLACLAVSISPLAAEASTDLAREWGAEANRLSAETAQLIHAVDLGQRADISDRYALDLYRFGRTSQDLAIWIDDSNGPNDLGCIFRGMAAESEDQLEQLELSDAPTARRESLRRLASMFADAEMIAVAAQRRAPAPGLAATGTKASCAADAAAVLEQLK